MKTLAEWILGSGISQTELSRRLGHENSGMVNAVVQGKRAIPRKKIDEWAAALGLSPAELPAFRVDAISAKMHRKTETRDDQAGLFDRVRRLETLVPILHDLVAGATRGEVKLPQQLRERIRAALEAIDSGA